MALETTKSKNTWRRSKKFDKDKVFVLGILLFWKMNGDDSNGSNVSSYSEVMNFIFGIYCYNFLKMDLLLFQQITALREEKKRLIKILVDHSKKRAPPEPKMGLGRGKPLNSEPPRPPNGVGRGRPLATSPIPPVSFEICQKS